MVRRVFFLAAIASLVLSVLAPRVSAAGGFSQAAVGPAALASTGGSGTLPIVAAPAVQMPHKPVCGVPAPRFAKCDADVVTNEAGQPLASTTPPSSAFTPAKFHTAYNLPCMPGGAVQSICAAPGSFGPQTIAIVDAYDDPTVENDLGIYDAQYGLPACTRANGCLSVLNETGGTALPTTVDQTWAFEISMDVQVAHALCQTCKILLLEANTNNYSDLGTAVNTAAKLGATAISNSYGGSEFSVETSYDSYYNHPGIAVVASSGDGGYGTEYPATSPYVVAVGGTSLTINADNTYNSERAWGNAGSGCSLYEPANPWQTQVANWSQTGCTTNHAATDVSADADPGTGAAVYDSTPYSGTVGWYQVGGTSLSSPIIASIYNLAGGVAAGVNAQSIPYSKMTTANSHDVATGSNGTCGTIMCSSVTGYDGPTGLGSPNGTSAFSSSSTSPPPPTATSVAPTATSVPPTATSVPPTSTPTATRTPAPTSTPISGPAPTATPCIINGRRCKK